MFAYFCTTPGLVRICAKICIEYLNLESKCAKIIQGENFLGLCLHKTLLFLHDLESFLHIFTVDAGN